MSQERTGYVHLMDFDMNDYFFTFTIQTRNRGYYLNRKYVLIQADTEAEARKIFGDLNPRYKYHDYVWASDGKPSWNKQALEELIATDGMVTDNWSEVKENIK